MESSPVFVCCWLDSGKLAALRAPPSGQGGGCLVAMLVGCSSPRCSGLDRSRECYGGMATLHGAGIYSLQGLQPPLLMR